MEDQKRCLVCTQTEQKVRLHSMFSQDGEDALNYKEASGLMPSQHAKICARCQVDLSICAKMTKMCRAVASESESEDSPPSPYQEIRSQISDLNELVLNATEKINQEVAFCVNSLAELKISIERPRGDGAKAHQPPSKPTEQDKGKELQQKSQRSSNSFKVYNFNLFDHFAVHTQNTASEGPPNIKEDVNTNATGNFEEFVPDPTRNVSSMGDRDKRRSRDKENTKKIALSSKPILKVKQNNGHQLKVVVNSKVKTRLSTGTIERKDLTWLLEDSRKTKATSLPNGVPICKKQRKVTFDERIQFKEISPRPGKNAGVIQKGSKKAF